MLKKFGFNIPQVKPLKGWFKDTLPGLVEQTKDKGIALLRLDGDWYESTLECLEALEPLVVQGGTIIIDDYFAYDGCVRAVHEYLYKKDLPYRILTAAERSSAYMYK